MAESSPHQASYFAPGPRAFWRWDAPATAVTFAAGTPTIALREELALVLEALQLEGLPRFDLVVTVLAAATGSGRQMFDLGGLPPIFTTARDPATKARLVQVLASRRTELVGTAAAATAARLRGSEPVHGPTLRRDSWTLSEARAWLRSRIAALDERLELAVRTGLTALPEAAALDLPHATRAQRLLDELDRDATLAPTAARARRLLAAWRPLRGRLGEPQVAAITPAGLSLRGPLDRLLLSELAHDPDVLLARLALGEALHSERDDRLPEPSDERLVLVDVGLRALGRPREFAAAIALAATAAQRRGRDGRTRVFAARPQLPEFDLATRQGLVGLLSELDHHVHPGHHVPELAARAEQVRGGAEVLLVVPHSVAADPEFVAACAVLAPYQLRTVVVHRDGRCELFEQRGRNRVRVLTAMLEAPARPPQQPGRPAIDPRACPLLLPPGSNAEVFWLEGVGTAWLSRRPRRLWFAEDGQHGGRRLDVAVPPVSSRLVLTRRREVVLMQPHGRYLELWCCAVDTGLIRTARVRLPRRQLTEYYVGWASDRLLLCHRDSSDRLLCAEPFAADPEGLQEIRLDSEVAPIHGDWLFCHRGWRQLEFDGSGQHRFAARDVTHLQCVARPSAPAVLNNVRGAFGYRDPQFGWCLVLRLKHGARRLAVQNDELWTSTIAAPPDPQPNSRITVSFPHFGCLALHDATGRLPDLVAVMPNETHGAMWWSPDHYVGNEYFLPVAANGSVTAAAAVLAAYAEALA